MTFVMNYLKDGMRNDSIDIQLHPICAKFLDDHECSYEDLSGLEDEQLAQFKTLFKAHRAQSLQGAS